jgi:ketosteroid isomerase-like protein
MTKSAGRAAGWLAATLAIAASAEQPDRKPLPSLDRTSIAGFNDSFTEAVRTMNNEAVLALWQDDGVALLPDTSPVRGKRAIRSMLQSVSSAHPKARMEHFTNECFDIERNGAWASEWCLEHQIVSEPGKPVFDSWGKMLFVLHKQRSGEWRLAREMWNHADSSERPSPPGIHEN